MDVKELFAYNLRRLMDETGCRTQSHLSRLSQVTQSHISVLLKARKLPNSETAQQLADAMGVDTFRLFLPQEMVEAGVEDLLKDYLRCPPEKRVLVRSLAQDFVAD